MYLEVQRYISSGRLDCPTWANVQVLYLFLKQLANSTSKYCEQWPVSSDHTKHNPETLGLTLFAQRGAATDTMMLEASTTLARRRTTGQLGKAFKFFEKLNLYYRFNIYSVSISYCVRSCKKSL